MTSPSYSDSIPTAQCIIQKQEKQKVEESQREIKQFTAKKKADIVMDIFQGKTTVAEVSRKYDLIPATIEE